MRSFYKRLIRAALCLSVLGPGAKSATAQTIEGVARDRGNAEALSGVLVSLLDADGERIRGVLTDTAGGFRLAVPMRLYRLRAERIGLETVTTAVQDLDDRQLFHEIEMSPRAIELRGLVVDSRVKPCRTGAREAEQIQRWWLDVRTALDVSAALQRERFGRFLVERFDREWAESLGDAVAENRRYEVSESTRPFVSAPPEQLVREGFAFGGYDPVYYGPDADVLLSTVFLAEHCFTLVDGRDRGGQVGLRFEPVPDREVVDIEGTLWVDTATAELTDLEFRYANLDVPDVGVPTGAATFEYLPSGAWIVSDWHIRLPKTGRRGRRSRLVEIGYFEGGGSVIPLIDSDPAARTGVVRGVLVDRLRGGGLEGAEVSVLGTERSAVTNAAGEFVLTDVPVGRHYVGFSTEEIDAWGLGTAAVPVEVTAGGAASVELEVPPFEEVALALCLTGGVDAQTVVVGRVVTPDGEPRRGRRIRLAFDRLTAWGGSRTFLDARTDDEGRFVACQVPPGTRVTLRRPVDGEWIDLESFTTSEGVVTYREIRLAR